MEIKSLIMTPSEASKSLRTTPNKVQALLEAGEIPAYREGRNWKIPTKCLEEYVISRAMKEAQKRKNIFAGDDGISE